jgi:lysine N6-hydroxylase
VTVHDLVGIGIGPFNLSLAALASPIEDLDAIFLERRRDFSWHPGMMLDGARVQVPFLADLVTLVDPTSRWSFLAYLSQRQRLYPFYFGERLHASRREYEDYCRWVAASLPSCRFGACVEEIRVAGGAFEVRLGGSGESLLARNLVLGVGTEPALPAALDTGDGAPILHSAEYLPHREELIRLDDVTVVGGGQSGAEIVLDLLRARPGGRLRWLVRSPAIAPMEYSKLGLEHFTPDYAAYFRELPEEVRDPLVESQSQLYRAISAETIADIQEVLYERSLGGWPEVEIRPHVEVLGARRATGGLELTCRHREQRRPFRIETGAVVAATGYRPRHPSFLEGLEALIDRDRRGRYRVGEDFAVALTGPAPGRIFVQNAELHSHGVGAPDLGLGAHRAASILNALRGRAVYPLPERTAFTTFGAKCP